MAELKIQEEGIRWIKNPVKDILDQIIGLGDSCQVQCGTISCKTLCSGGYCYKHSDG